MPKLIKKKRKKKIENGKAKKERKLAAAAAAVPALVTVSITEFLSAYLYLMPAVVSIRYKKNFLNLTPKFLSSLL